MKIIRRKNKPLILAVLAGVLALAIAAAIILTNIAKNDVEKEEETPIPVPLAGEAVYGTELIAFDRIDSNKFLFINIKGKNGNYSFTRKDESVDANTTDAEGNAITHKINESAFILSYVDSDGVEQIYYPDIAMEDPDFEYEDLYAVETGDAYGVYKIVYLTVALGTAYFNERIDISAMDAQARENEYKKFGLDDENAVTVSFRYIDKNNNEDAIRTIRIGDKLVTGYGYYFTVSDTDAEGNIVERPMIYSASRPTLSYALGTFADFINPILTAKGLEVDGAFEPYLTTDYKQYVNTLHGGAGENICNAPGCKGTGICHATISDTDRVIANANILSTGKFDAIQDDVIDGYTNVGLYKNEIFDLSQHKDKATFKALIDFFIGRGVNAPFNEVAITLFDYSRALNLAAQSEYRYIITHVEAIVGNGVDITAPGTAIPAGSKIRVSYRLQLQDKNNPGVWNDASAYNMHGVLDLSMSYVPSEVKAALTHVGPLTAGNEVDFTINYNETNSIARDVKMYIDDIVRIYDPATQRDVATIKNGVQVVYHYYVVVDGVRSDVQSDYITVNDASENGEIKQISNLLMGRTVGSKLALHALSYKQYQEIFADMTVYNIKSIEYFVKSECIVSFEFQQASERDPFYGESIYKNTLENENNIYGLNASVCELVTKVLGGVQTNATGSEGLVGSETVAVGLTAEILKKYDLYAYTIYFELPRYITSLEFDNSQYSDVNDYLNGLDDYRYYDTLGFTLYISPEQIDGSRYIASDLYDIVAKVDGKDFVFLKYDFVEFFARRNLLLTNITNIKNMSFTFFMDDIQGEYSSELVHKQLYTYNGALITKAIYDEMVAAYNALSDEEKRTQQNPATLARPFDGINVYTKLTGEGTHTNFKDFYNEKEIVDGVEKPINEPYVVSGVNYGVSMNKFYDKYGDGTKVELDPLATSNFKEVVETIFYTRYENILTDEERAAAVNAPLLMKMKITLGERYSEDDPLREYEVLGGIYKPANSYDYSYEFYRVSDRKIMVRIYREDRLNGNVTESVSDFYISTFAFKKIVTAYVAVLNGENIDNDTVYID